MPTSSRRALTNRTSWRSFAGSCEPSPGEEDMIRVLIAEDSAVMQEVLRHVLSEDPVLQVVSTVQNGLEAAEQTARLKPDVVVMDVHMPQMGGFEATRRIMERT